MSQTYAPPAEMVATTHVTEAKYNEVYAASISDPVAF